MAFILIVEDNQINYELASELLEYAGHSTVKCETLPQCLDAINRQKPDLILMDLNLSEANGLEITRNLKNSFNTKDITIVAFTAMVMDKDRKEAFRAGCSGFIAKPFNVSTFVSTVENYIKTNKHEHKNIKQQTLFPPKNNIEANTDYNVIEGDYKRHNILVVDDNLMNADILKESLQQLGQDVKLAYNGKEVFEIIEKEQIDLVLLDIMMPDISGFDIIKQFKANPKTVDLPVIFVSALDKTSDIVKGFKLGSYEYIVKPYKIEELKARVLSILKIKELQDQLKSEKKILDLIFRFSEDGMLLLNSNYEIISCNNIFLKWMAKSQKEVLNKEFCEAINYDHEYCSLNFYNKNLYFNFEIEVNKDKEKKFIEANCSKISAFSENTEGGYVMVLRDVTAKREIEIQKETFVATLTHDLKTPVRAQTKALELLLNNRFGQVNEAQKEILTETLNSNKYMAGMLDNLLSTYKYENGNVVIKKQDTDVNNLIKSCYNELKHLAENKKHQVKFNFSEDRLNAFLDPIEIKRVFLNLISNAINYTDEKGEIIISTGKRENNSIISFADNGRGISLEEKSRLFSKFTSYSKRFRQVGTGLGLYLSKKIIESHGGTISLESEEGKGSCFTVSIPLYDQSSKA